MSVCNYCRYKSMVRDAKEKNLEVTKVSGGGDAVEVFVHPKGVNIGKLSPKEREKIHHAWFMELPNFCDC